ncbi:ABC transporter substrate-binding protein [Paenibacillus eucommiae]|uniref:Iron complex transport system substrate-binding protein n=1 Tax=Paenibacillus eucommiae TaxID=1355755 RepID=A0ABS4J5R3_9BACL|nr:ABC transporter substrate-binding protein [Paenibacillus eucommiae]MBP1995145.1 iron complex transport system substrate-binding protein [Paenibacillus eucommiae]
MQKKTKVTSLLMLLLLLLVAAACGSKEITPDTGGSVTNTEEKSAVNSPSAEPNKEKDSSAKTRIFEHAKGKTEIPTHPERIIAIQYTGAMLALGVKPVGGDNEWSVYPLLAKEWEGIEHVGDPWTGLNLEKIIELEPDLIVTHAEQTYEQLSKIAPTLFIPWLQYDVREQITVFGDILGKQPEAEAWLERFDAKVEATKQQAGGIIGSGETVAIVNVRPKNQFIYGDSAMGGYVIYQALDLNAPESIQRDVLDQKKAALEISLEALPDYLSSADYIFLSVLEADGGKERAEEVKNSALWKNLPAAKNNHIYALDWNTYFTTDPLSTEKQLDTFAGLLSAIKK